MIIDPRLTARRDVTADEFAADRATIERELITELRNATAGLGAETDNLVAVTGLAQVAADEHGRTPFIAQWSAKNDADIVGGRHDGQTVPMDADTTVIEVPLGSESAASGAGGTARYRRAGINDRTGNWAFVPE